MENNILNADIGYWKSRHRQAVEREEALQKELQDKIARVKYLTRQLYEKKTEQSKNKLESQEKPRRRKNATAANNLAFPLRVGGTRDI